jgi:transcriptional regulator of heat shock response
VLQALCAHVSILSQLEDSGYVHQPHTSAGRVPTDRAYRVFVDLLLEGRRRVRTPAEVETHLREQAERSPLLDDVLASVSHFVSRAAKHVGFALSGTPLPVLQRLEFVPLGLVLRDPKGDEHFVPARILLAGLRRRQAVKPEDPSP